MSGSIITTVGMVNSSMAQSLYKDKRGAVEGIWWVVITMMVVFSIMTILTIHEHVLLRDNIVGQSDLAATSALVYAVNQAEFWDENLELDKSLAKRKYRQLMEDEFSNRNSVNRVSIRRVKVYGPGDLSETQLKRLGINTSSNNTERNQYFLESIVAVEFPTNRLLDKVANTGIRWYDVIKGRNDSFYESGAQGDGRHVILVRSLGRVVLR